MTCRDSAASSLEDRGDPPGRLARVGAGRASSSGQRLAGWSRKRFRPVLCRDAGSGWNQSVARSRAVSSIVLPVELRQGGRRDVPPSAKCEEFRVRKGCGVLLLLLLYCCVP
jgi:hypothetical protein